MKRAMAGFMMSLLLATSSAQAELIARPGRLDPRVRTLPYSAEQVFVVTGTYGMVTTILFGADEEITQVSPVTPSPGKSSHRLTDARSP